MADELIKLYAKRELRKENPAPQAEEGAGSARRAGQPARTDGSDTYSVTVTLQTTGARTLAALEQYGFDLDSLLTQAQAQLKERQ